MGKEWGRERGREGGETHHTRARFICCVTSKYTPHSTSTTTTTINTQTPLFLAHQVSKQCICHLAFQQHFMTGQWFTWHTSDCKWVATGHRQPVKRWKIMYLIRNAYDWSVIMLITYSFHRLAIGDSFELITHLMTSVTQFATCDSPMTFFLSTLRQQLAATLVSGLISDSRDTLVISGLYKKKKRLNRNQSLTRLPFTICLCCFLF